jgi:hypothetical protein
VWGDKCIRPALSRCQKTVSALRRIWRRMVGQVGEFRSGYAFELTWLCSLELDHLEFPLTFFGNFSFRCVGDIDPPLTSSWLEQNMTSRTDMGMNMGMEFL